MVLIASAYIYKGPLKKWQDNLGQPNNFLAKLNSDKISKIEINSSGNQTILSKTGEKWKYNNSKDFYADTALMSQVLAELKKAGRAKLELVSNNQASKKQYGTDGAGTEVKIYENDKLAVDFLIGLRSGDYSGSYISASASAATYAVAADLTDVFNPGEWLDLTIFSTDQAKINKIRFQYPNREFTLELKNGKWSVSLPTKFSVNQEKVKLILDIMSNLKAAQIPEQTFKNTGLEKHLAIIQATGEGIDNTLMVGEGKDGLYYAKRGDSDNIYLITKAQRDELNKTTSQLR